MSQDFEKVKSTDDFLEFSQTLFEAVSEEDISYISQGVLKGEKIQEDWFTFFKQVLGLEWLRQNYLLFPPHPKQKLTVLITNTLILIAVNILVYLFLKNVWVYATLISFLIFSYWIFIYFKQHKVYTFQLTQYQEIEKKIQIFDNPAFENLAYLTDSLLFSLFESNSAQNVNKPINLEMHIFSFFPFTEEIRLPYFNLEGDFLNHEFVQWKIDIQNHVPQAHADALLTFQESQMDIVGQFITQKESNTPPNLRYILDFDAAGNRYLDQFNKTLEEVFIAFYLFFLIKAYPKQKPLEEHVFYNKLPVFSRFVVQVFYHIHKLQQATAISKFEVYETKEKCQYNYIKPFAPHKSQLYKSDAVQQHLKRKEVIYFQVPILNAQIELSSQVTATIQIIQEIQESRFTRFTADPKKIEINKRHITHICYKLTLQYDKTEVRLNKKPTAILPKQQNIHWQVEETIDTYQIETWTEAKSYSLSLLPDFNLLEQVFIVGMSLVSNKV